MFCTASVVVFVITGQVLIIFYKTAASSRLDIAGLLCVHQQLSAATNHLTICFTPILLTNCAHIFFCLIFYSHSFLSFVSDLTELSQTMGGYLMDCGYLKPLRVFGSFVALRMPSIRR